jgi:hypothetical protein
MISRKLVGFAWVLALLIAPDGVAESLPDDHPLQIWLTNLASPEQRVQRSAAYSLKTIGPDPQQSALALIEALKNANPYVRRHAAMAIGEFRVAPDLTAPALVQALVDPDSTVREHATSALAKLGLAAYPAINKALGSDDSAPAKSGRDTVPLVADYAAAALIEMGPEVISPLIADGRAGFDDSSTYVLQQQPAAVAVALTKYLHSDRVVVMFRCGSGSALIWFVVVWCTLASTRLLDSGGGIDSASFFSACACVVHCTCFCRGRFPISLVDSTGAVISPHP